MTITARWPELPSWAVRLLPVVAVGLSLVGFEWAAYLLLAVVAAWWVTGVSFVAAGGGFRPLRSSDLIDFAAADQLDAFDREQAMAEAKRAAQRPSGGGW